MTLRATSLHNRALAAVIAALFLWSLSSLFVRASHSNALVFTTYRLWFALPPLALIVLVRRRRGHDVMMFAPGMSRLRWLMIVAGAGAFFGAGVVTAFEAIGRTRLLDVTLVGALEPVLIVAFAVVFLGEPFERDHVARGAVAIAGTVLVAASGAGGGSWSLAGELFAVASLVTNAGWFLYGRVLRDRFPIDPVAFMFGVLASAAVLVTPIAFISAHGLHLSHAAIAYAACTMVSGTTAHVLLVWGHRYLPASVSAPLLLAQPPIVAIAAWVCFGEAPGVIGVIGSAVVIGALWGMARSPAVTHVEDATPDPTPPT